MRNSVTLLVSLLMVAALAGNAPAARRTYSHQEDMYEHYEGTSTCLECHEEEATTFFHSQHYQWQGQSPHITNADGEMLGKMNTMNDFCTNPAASWIGNSVNAEGQVLAQGCSKCHAGLGKMPSSELSREQLENIDCLICHAVGYRRDAYQDEDGNWEWRPILWKNQAGLDAISKRIVLPERKMCLRCHAGAGGGQNFKRGDIEYTLANCEPDFDVHMASSGNDMQCIACHQGEDHRVRGRGTDLSATDYPEDLLSCTSCHDEKPHALKALDAHTDRVNCTVCHIPDFAQSDPTDMRRDWSQPVYVEAKDKWTPTFTMATHVQPVYAWFNGDTRLMKMGEPVRYNKDGTVTIMEPQGSRKDKTAKIFAFKLHEGVLPIWKDKEWLIPVAVDEFFVDGDIHEAVEAGAKAAYGASEEVEYDWVESRRYMGLFHEVRPANQALQCLDCHREGGRMDWKALGYKKDPLLSRMK